MNEQKRKRLTSEKSLQHNTFKLKLGTMDKTNPLVVYLEGKAFIMPKIEKEDYSDDIKDFKYALEQAIRKNLSNNNHFQNHYILDFQIARSGIKINKKSFLTFELLLRQCSSEILKLGDIKKCSEDDLYKTINTLEQNIVEHNFSLSKTKK